MIEWFTPSSKTVQYKDVFVPPVNSHYVFDNSLDILRQPPDALAVPLPHDDGAHEDLNRPDALERDLAFTRCLVHAKLVAELVLGNGIGVVDLVSQNDKRHLGELLHGEERVEFGLGLDEPFVVLGINEKHDTVNFREVVLPEAASCVSAQPSATASADVHMSGNSDSKGESRGNEPCAWPPRSNVVNLTLPIANSSEASPHHVSQNQSIPSSGEVSSILRPSQKPGPTH